MVVVPVDARGGLARDVMIDARGVLDAAASPGLLVGAQREVRDAIAALPHPASGSSYDENTVIEAVRFAVRRSFGRALGSKPVTVVQLVRVAG
jgi:hypothetical protein